MNSKICGKTTMTGPGSCLRSPDFLLASALCLLHVLLVTAVLRACLIGMQQVEVPASSVAVFVERKAGMRGFLVGANVQYAFVAESREYTGKEIVPAVGFLVWSPSRDVLQGILGEYAVRKTVYVDPKNPERSSLAGMDFGLLWSLVPMWGAGLVGWSIVAARLARARMSHDVADSLFGWTTVMGYAYMCSLIGFCLWIALARAFPPHALVVALLALPVVALARDIADMIKVTRAQVADR